MNLLIWIVAVLIIAGLVDFLVQRSTFVSEPYKGTIRWVILAGVIIIFIYFLWPFVPQPSRR